MPDRVLITGGSGFIGSHLILELLARGDQIVNYDIRPHSGPMAWLLGSQLSHVVYEEGTAEDWPSLIAAIPTPTITAT